MSTEPMRTLIVEAVLNDPYDGAIRLLGDAERFGFELRSLALKAEVAGGATATITLHIPTSVDVQLVSARLARHPAVQRVNTHTETGTAVLGPPRAVAA